MSVLDKDTDLTFPHVLIIDASAGSGKTEVFIWDFTCTINVMCDRQWIG